MSEEDRSSGVERRSLAAEAPVEAPLLVLLANAEVVAPEFQRPLDHCQHPNLPKSRLVPCFRTAPLPDQRHASLALPRPLAAPESFAGNLRSVQACLSLCMH